MSIICLRGVDQRPYLSATLISSIALACLLVMARAISGVSNILVDWWNTSFISSELKEAISRNMKCVVRTIAALRAAYTIDSVAIPDVVKFHRSGQVDNEIRYVSHDVVVDTTAMAARYVN